MDSIKEFTDWLAAESLAVKSISDVWYPPVETEPSVPTQTATIGFPNALLVGAVIVFFIWMMK